MHGDGVGQWRDLGSSCPPAHGPEAFLARTNDGAFIIDLLPALPKAWPTGFVRGLRARGGVAVDLTWRDGKLDEAHLTSASGGPLHVRLGNQIKQFQSEAGRIVVLKGPELIRN